MSTLLLAAVVATTVSSSARDPDPVALGFRAATDIPVAWEITTHFVRNSTPDSPWFLREETEEVLRLTDRQTLSARFGVIALVREFERVQETRSEASGPNEAESTAVDVVRSSPIEGAVVRFVQDPVRGTWRHELLAGEPAQKGYVDGLEPDQEGACFLPEGTVLVGETWRLDERGLAYLFWPSGALHILAPDVDSAPYYARYWQQRDNLSGSGRATLEGLESIRGIEVARVALVLRGRTWYLDSRDSSMVEHRAQITGTLLWDLKAGRLFSLELNGEERIRVRLPTESGGWREILLTSGSIGQHTRRLAAARGGTADCR